MARTRQRAMLTCLLVLLAFPALASAKRAVPYSPSDQKSFDAVLTDWAPIARTPGGKAVFELQPQSFYSTKTQRLLVLGARDVNGQRWLKILWKMWQTGTSYDADLHARNQLKHGSWVLKLQPA